ncbi:MAG: hypothetical protein IJK59_04895 [Firmicutes bacterium]|nr:hypothetical protein [Bacillota bacterium]
MALFGRKIKNKAVASSEEPKKKSQDPQEPPKKKEPDPASIAAEAHARRQQKERSLKEAQMAEARATVKMILSIMETERGNDNDSPEWDEFENMLNQFLNGEITDVALSNKVLENVKSFTKGKKNFMKSVKSQIKVEQALQEIEQSTNMANNPIFKPVMMYMHETLNEAKKKREEEMLSHIKESDADGWALMEGDSEYKKLKKEEMRKDLEEQGWVIVGEDGEETQKSGHEDDGAEKDKEAEGSVLVLKKDPYND